MPDQLRIAHLTATFPPYPGGAGNTAFRFATEQAERGHEVEVFTAPAEGKEPDPGQVKVHRIEPVFAIGNAPMIPSLARLDGFDIIHLHYPFIFGSELTMLGRLRRKRRHSAALLVHYKNRLSGRGPRGALFEAYEHSVAPALIRASDRICVLSHEHARSVSYLRRALERTPERIVVMPNGVDGEVFSPGADQTMREHLGIPASAFVATFVGTLDMAHHFKRVDVAIDGLAELSRSDGPEVHLVVAGGGELLDGYRERALAAGIGGHVHFLGSVPHAELPEVLRGSDAFLLTTEPPESFGIVLIEAMACGLPVIATEYPGVRAVVDDKENGFLIEPSSPGAVARALDQVASMEADEREALGAAGRAKTEREWAWPALVRRMDDTYGAAIEARREKVGNDP